MLTSGISMKRWNSYPRIEDISHLDNVWFTLHIAMFLSYLEEKEWKIVDKEFIMKRIIFNSMKTLVISDINSGTRHYIEKINKDIFNKIEKKVIDHIISFDAPDYLKQDMIDTLDNKEKKLELSIIEASKKYAWYKECLVNRKVFEDMYEVPYNDIMLYLKNKRKDLNSLDKLLKNQDYEKYLTNIRKLSHSIRWNQEKRIFPISVMSHLVLITYISYIIWTIENNIGTQKYNIFEMMFKALYHDIPEAITWDIITPTKKAVEWFEKILEEVEVKMLNDFLFSYVWDDYKWYIKDYMLTPWSWDCWPLVKSSDLISALLEAKVEVNHGSTNYIEIYRKIKKIINKYNNKSIDYILKQTLDSFDDINNNIHL